MLRGFCLGHLQARSPIGDCRWRGLFVQGTQDVRGSFLLDTDLWAHPRVATTVGGSFHWTLGHGTHSPHWVPHIHNNTIHHKRPPALLYKSAWTRGLRQRGFCSLLGLVWPGRPSRLHGNWFVWWPRRPDDTGAGGLISSVLVLTPIIRTHCLRRWADAGGLIPSVLVLTPTIRTHCFR